MDENSTIEEARAHVADGRKTRAGVLCPCCDKYCKEWSYHLGGAWLTFLECLIRASEKKEEGAWLQSRDFLPSGQKASSNGTHFVHWGFIEKKEHGFYRPTALGIEFAAGRIDAPAFCVTYNNKVISWSEKRVKADDIRGKPFSLTEASGVHTPVTNSQN